MITSANSVNGHRHGRCHRCYSNSIVIWYQTCRYHSKPVDVIATVDNHRVLRTIDTIDVIDVIDVIGIG